MMFDCLVDRPSWLFNVSLEALPGGDWPLKLSQKAPDLKHANMFAIRSLHFAAKHN